MFSFCVLKIQMLCTFSRFSLFKFRPMIITWPVDGKLNIEFEESNVVGNLLYWNFAYGSPSRVSSMFPWCDVMRTSYQPIGQQEFPIIYWANQRRRKENWIPEFPNILYSQYMAGCIRRRSEHVTSWLLDHAWFSYLLATHWLCVVIILIVVQITVER